MRIRRQLKSLKMKFLASAAAAVALCSAGVHAECIYCPDGLPEGNAAIDLMEGQTCGSLADLAASLPADDAATCSQVQMAQDLCCPAAGAAPIADAAGGPGAVAGGGPAGPAGSAGVPVDDVTGGELVNSTAPRPVTTDATMPATVDATVAATKTVTADGPNAATPATTAPDAADADNTEPDSGVAAVRWAAASVPTMAMATIVLLA